MENQLTKTVPENPAAPRKPGRPRKDPFGSSEKSKQAKRPAASAKKAGGRAETDSIHIRIGASEKAAFQAEADRLGISLTDLMSIRIGATSGLTLAMVEIEKMRREVDRTAGEFARVQPQLDDIWAAAQEAQFQMESMRKKDLTMKLLSDRLIDAAKWREDAVNIFSAIQAIEDQIDKPANAIAKEVERLADLLADLKAGG